MRQRPLTPHLSIYKPTAAMAASIAHRLSGLALIAALPLLIWWLAAASSGPEAYGVLLAFYASTPGKTLLFAYSWILGHHMIGGLRHLLADIGVGLDVEAASLSAKLGAILSFSLTVVFWAVVPTLRGEV